MNKFEATPEQIKDLFRPKLGYVHQVDFRIEDTDTYIAVFVSCEAAIMVILHCADDYITKQWTYKDAFKQKGSRDMSLERRQERTFKWVADELKVLAVNMEGPPHKIFVEKVHWEHPR